MFPFLIHKGRGKTNILKRIIYVTRYSPALRKITTQKIGLVRLSVFFSAVITPVPKFKVKLIHINIELTLLLMVFS